MVFFISDLWEDDGVSWDNPSSVVFNRKVYKCTDSLGCGCPMLLCTGKEDCERLDSNPITCQLTQPYEKINLQNAKLEFFSKGDCKCNPL